MLYCANMSRNLYRNIYGGELTNRQLMNQHNMVLCSAIGITGIFNDYNQYYDFCKMYERAIIWHSEIEAYIEITGLYSKNKAKPISKIVEGCGGTVVWYIMPYNQNISYAVFPNEMALTEFMLTYPDKL